VKTILTITSKYLRDYKIMLIFNIKTDKDNTFVTPPEIIQLGKSFFLRINRPGTQEKTKHDF
jgi:hypothetical protein